MRRRNAGSSCGWRQHSPSPRPSPGGEGGGIRQRNGHEAASRRGRRRRSGAAPRDGGVSIVGAVAGAGGDSDRVAGGEGAGAGAGAISSCSGPGRFWRPEASGGFFPTRRRENHLTPGLPGLARFGGGAARSRLRAPRAISEPRPDVRRRRGRGPLFAGPLGPDVFEVAGHAAAEQLRRGDPGPCLHSRLDARGFRARVGPRRTADDRATCCRGFPRHDQVTRLCCVEGWSAIAWWGGLRFADFLRAFPPAPGALGAPAILAVNLDSAGNPDPYYVSIDLPTARHPQTLLATHFREVPFRVAHGAPLRLLAPMKLGPEEHQGDHRDRLLGRGARRLLERARVLEIRRTVRLAMKTISVPAWTAAAAAILLARRRGSPGARRRPRASSRQAAGPGGART